MSINSIPVQSVSGYISRHCVGKPLYVQEFNSNSRWLPFDVKTNDSDPELQLKISPTGISPSRLLFLYINAVPSYSGRTLISALTN
jgi:hypothetical protein